MTPWGTKFSYVLVYILAVFVGAFAAIFCDENYFGQIGASIIIFAIWRGTRSLRRSGVAAFSEIEKDQGLKILRWDTVSYTHLTLPTILLV